MSKSFFGCAFLLLLLAALGVGAAPVIDPIGLVVVPAGKSLIVPITATVTNGRPLTFTVKGSNTNAIALVLHTNNLFWKLNVAQACASNAPGAFQTPYRGGLATVTNVGDMTFMLFPEYAPHTVAIFQGLSDAGFYNSNTIFPRVLTNSLIQGGDPLTNGSGGLVFEYNDEFNPQVIYSGSGQLGVASSGKNTAGSQFFVTVGQQRELDFQYTIFGQLVRGFNVLSNLDNTVVDTNNRPLADEIITQAGLVPDTCDTVLTLTATNRTKLTNIVTVVADDGAGGRATNTFTAVAMTDTNSNFQPFIYGLTVTNLVAKTNVILTNYISAVELDGKQLYWFVLYGNDQSYTNSTITGNYFNYTLRTQTYNETNVQGILEFFVKPTNNYAGPVTVYWVVSTNAGWETDWEYYPFFGPVPEYDELMFTFVFGDTRIVAQPAAVAPQPTGTFTNLLLATFTNGVPGSAVTNFTASIQWGDDSISTGTITTNTARFKQVLGSHTYTNSAGNYPIYITIQSWLGVTAVVTNTITVPPPLSLMRAGTNNVVGWPSWAFAYGVQSNTNLTGTNWIAVTNASALAGFQNVMSNAAPAGGKMGFYRLKE